MTYFFYFFFFLRFGLRAIFFEKGRLEFSDLCFVTHNQTHFNGNNFLDLTIVVHTLDYIIQDGSRKHIIVNKHYLYGF